MKYVINKDCSISYLDDISENGGILKWEYRIKPDFVLVVSAPFYDNVEIDEIISVINNKNITLSAQDTCVCEGVFCRLISTIQGKNVCKITHSPAVFRAFGCIRNDGNIVVYEEKNTSHNTCKVSAKIGYRLEKIIETRTNRRLFSKTVNEYVFSKITILEGVDFNNEAIYYCFEGCPHKFFITKSMIGKPFYVRWYNDANQPIIRQNIDGITLERR